MYLEMTDLLVTLSQLPFFGRLLHISALSACSTQTNGQMNYYSRFLSESSLQEECFGNDFHLDTDKQRMELVARPQNR